jgi:hypothetical protein
MSFAVANLFLAGAILSTVLPIALVVAFTVYWLVYVRRRPGGE